MNTSNLTVTSSGVVRLCLKNKSYKSRRAIGWLSTDGETFHTKRNPTHQLFYKLNAYGINFDVLNQGRFIWVVIELPFGRILVTSRKYYLAKGTILNFKENKLERQVFLPIPEFGIDKARVFEAEILRNTSKDDQSELFGEVA